ncbi:NAD(P)-dependent oxidoreductase [Crenothrix polyspora]|uniref:3-hydroxyisobutyrate dehydrogenase n=1 Tax=Crenothrix polyspora TaxID=360316 RepID=A0A1R4H9Q9_9GAMM|nr:NAD(P)-dependent oxidoreductase [Crenothrix polyspora]SJM92998.1 3-hydroxyisobutyrate dehydrogenase [Crenothrix polyspora]
MKVGFIGLGAMGVGMASNLAKAGLLTAIYNRTTEKAERLAQALGVVAVAQPDVLAAQVDVLFLCVSADADVLEMVNAIAQTLKSGSIVVDMSTVSSDTAQQAANILAEKQVGFLDAPVSGGVEGAKNGTLAMMVGGNESALQKIMPILQAMATRIMHMGEVGTGQATKAVNQVMCAGINQAVTEALAFAQAQHLPMEKVIKVLAGGAAGNWFLDKRGLTMTSGIFEPGFRLALHHKDLKICQAISQHIDFSSPLTDMTVIDYEQLMAHGLGDEDISALYRLKTGLST